MRRKKQGVQNKSEKKHAPGTFGRPAKYKPEFCQMLIDHMAQGLSFESFAGLIGTCRQTIYSWEKNYPDFLDAKQHGTEKCRLFWEKIGIEGTTGQLKTTLEEIVDENGEVKVKKIGRANFNAQSWALNMKNRFQWKDKHEIDHSSEDGSMKPQVQIYLPSNGREVKG